MKAKDVVKENWFEKKQAETSSEGTMWKHKKLLDSFAKDRRICSD